MTNTRSIVHKATVFLCLALLAAETAQAAGKAEHVVVIVWDGMRPDFISKEHSPTLYQLAQDGVMFQNHHPVYCSSTEVNGTALATGCYPAHSGIIANTMYLPEIDRDQPVGTQNPDVVRKGDALSGGRYLLRPTLVETLREAGRRTAVAGVKAVALLQDRREWTTNSDGVTLYEGTAIPAAALGAIVDKLGPFPKNEGNRPNTGRNEWTTRALTRMLWSNGVPAFSLLWLSEPDASQHASGPGSSRSLAAIESSDRQLAAVLSELESRGLRDKTDVMVVSDHGFSTIQKVVDIAETLRANGFSAKRKFKSTPKAGDVLVVGQGGSVLFYVVGHDEHIIRKLVKFLQQQEFSGVIFANLETKGTFPLDKANINCPNPPDVVLSMHWSPDKSPTGAPGIFYSDSGSEFGGAHGSLSHFDMHNTLVGAGPDFKKGFIDTLPTANTDLAPTILWILGVKPKVPMDGRIFGEALVGNPPAPGKPVTRRLEAKRQTNEVNWQQYLQVSQVDDTVYLDEGNGESKQSH